MATQYILYNPKAGFRTDYEEILRRLKAYTDEPKFLNVSQISDYHIFLASLEQDDTLILAGGDGTLNRFINDTSGITIKQNILYYPIGTGNDFAADVGHSKNDAPFRINNYLQDLPTVQINGTSHRFINGVGFGIDGYCCAEGDLLRDKAKKPINYTTIAINGLLFHYKPTNAIVTVDGKRRAFSRVWLAPVMFGSRYGGGMLPAPNQHRGKDTLSVMLFHGAGRLRTLMAFPGIFKGTHIKHDKMVTVLEGRSVTVEFSRPTPLQIDGETIVDVKSYTAVR